jgi:Ser/Thr protein kinase RdoA (MazF antagonist)
MGGNAGARRMTEMFLDERLAQRSHHCHHTDNPGLRKTNMRSADDLANSHAPNAHLAAKIHARRTHRPISYSTTSVEKIEHLFTQYPFEGPVEVTFYMLSVSDTYLLTTPASKFFLKVYRAGWRSQEALAQEIAAIEHAHARGVKVAVPIARRDGSWITYIRAPEGIRPAILFPWIKGRAPEYTDPRHAAAFGTAIAQLHLACEDFNRYDARPRFDLDFLFRRPIERIRSRLQELPAVAARLERLAVRLESRLSQVEGRLTDWGFCHGDIWADNARIDGDDLVLFDFDFFGPGWRVSDLAAYRWHARLKGSESIAWEAFSTAYLRVRPSAEQSLQYSDIFVMLRHLWFKAHNINRAFDVGAYLLTDAFLEDTVSFCEKLEAEQVSAAS